MYKKILVPLENGWADATILQHARDLALLTGASLTLLHVADGFAARNYEQLELVESEEIKKDRAYLHKVAADLKAAGFSVETMLAKGDPASQIIRVAQEKQVDLIAMATHGHRLFADFLFGTTATKVRHRVSIPVLFVKAKKAS